MWKPQAMVGTNVGENVGGLRAPLFVIDTNVLIDAEDNADHPTAQGLAASVLLSNASRAGHFVAISDGSRKDFLRASDPLRARRLRQLGRYSVLAPIKATEEQRTRFNTPTSAGANDQCDLEILCAVANNAATFLVTEDRQLRRKAERGGLGDRVLAVEDANWQLANLDGERSVLPTVSTVKAYQIPLEAPILATLRSDYHDFDGWWKKVQLEHRAVIVVGEPDDPEAICVLKVENAPPSNRPAMLPSLKLCTFKVREDSPGNKFGELLLKAAIERARAGAIGAMYLSLFPSKSQFIDFLGLFGFEQIEAFSSPYEGEIALEKLLEPGTGTYSPIDHAIRFGPGSAVAGRAHIIPIHPDYCDTLFPEAQAVIGLGIVLSTEACGNAIRKAYLSNSVSRKLAPGDLVAFYRTAPDQAVVVTGVVESTLVSRDPERIVQYVGSRTVYSIDQIADLCSKGDVLATLFRYDRVVSVPATITELLSTRVLSAAPQSITEVPTSRVGWLCERLLR